MNREEMQTELDALKARIAEIEAQLAEPEWVPFVGEIIQARASKDASWSLRVATGYKDETGRVFAYTAGTDSGPETAWAYARPLSNPNVIQLRPHAPGDPMPCAPDTRVIVRFVHGAIPKQNLAARDWDWRVRGEFGIAAWAPLP